MNDVNLKTLVHSWFDYKNEDDTNRPEWIEEKVKNYKNGVWSVE